MVYQAKRAGFLSHGGSPTKPWVSEKKWSSMTWMIWGYPHDLGNLQIVSRSPLWLNLVSGFNTPVSWSLGDCRPIYIYIYTHTCLRIRNMVEIVSHTLSWWWTALILNPHCWCSPTTARFTICSGIYAGQTLADWWEFPLVIRLSYKPGRFITCETPGKKNRDPYSGYINPNENGLMTNPYGKMKQLGYHKL